MATKLTDQLVDKRLIDRNLKKGLLDRQGLEKHIADLKDASENLEQVPYYEPEEEAVEGETGETVQGEAAVAVPAEVTQA